MAGYFDSLGLRGLDYNNYGPFGYDSSTQVPENYYSRKSYSIFDGFQPNPHNPYGNAYPPYPQQGGYYYPQQNNFMQMMMIFFNNIIGNNTKETGADPISWGSFEHDTTDFINNIESADLDKNGNTSKEELNTHLESINSQITALELKETLTDEETAQIAKLKEQKEMITLSINAFDSFSTNNDEITQRDLAKIHNAAGRDGDFGSITNQDVSGLYRQNKNPFNIFASLFGNFA